MPSRASLPSPKTCNNLLIAWKRCVLSHPMMDCSSMEKKPVCAALFQIWRNECEEAKSSTPRTD